MLSFDINQSINESIVVSCQIPSSVVNQLLFDIINNPSKPAFEAVAGPEVGPDTYLFTIDVRA